MGLEGAFVGEGGGSDDGGGDICADGNAGVGSRGEADAQVQFGVGGRGGFAGDGEDGADTLVRVIANGLAFIRHPRAGNDGHLGADVNRVAGQSDGLVGAIHRLGRTELGQGFLEGVGGFGCLDEGVDVELSDLVDGEANIVDGGIEGAGWAFAHDGERRLRADRGLPIDAEAFVGIAERLHLGSTAATAIDRGGIRGAVARRGPPRGPALREAGESPRDFLAR